MGADATSLFLMLASFALTFFVARLIGKRLKARRDVKQAAVAEQLISAAKAIVLDHILQLSPRAILEYPAQMTRAQAQLPRNLRYAQRAFR